MTTEWIRDAVGCPDSEYHRGLTIPKAVQIVSIDPGEIRPLSSAAAKLVDDYMRRLSFVQACDLGLTVEMAGKKALDLGKTQTYKVFSELEAYGNPDPLTVRWWYCDRAMNMIQTGETPDGYRTQSSCVATAFFLAMIGGQAGVTTLLSCFAARTTIRDFEAVISKHGDHEKEAFRYIVQSHLLWRLEP